MPAWLLAADEPPEQATAVAASKTRATEYVFEIVFMVSPKVADGSSGTESFMSCRGWKSLRQGAAFLKDERVVGA
jgi:hypothetical protein